MDCVKGAYTIRKSVLVCPDGTQILRKSSTMDNIIFISVYSVYFSFMPNKTIVFIFSLQTMQAEVDSLHVEVSRRESSIDLVNTEKERLINRLRTEEGV